MDKRGLEFFKILCILNNMNQDKQTPQDYINSVIDKRLKILVDILVEKGILTEDERHEIFSMEPFPETV